MMELALAADFPSTTREQWRDLVEAVLRKSGASYDSLVTRTYDGIDIQPLYTEASAKFPGLAPAKQGWDVRQRHAVPDKLAVMNDLEGGVTSLWLALPAETLQDVLADVYLDLAPVVVDGGAEFAETGRAMLRIYDEAPLLPEQVHGNLGADPLGLHARTGITPDLAVAIDLTKKARKLFPHLRTIVVDAQPYHNAGGSDAEELGASIAAGVTYLRALTEAGLSADEAFGQLEFRYAATADQFLTIAKLRAARRLWARVAEVSGATAKQVQHAVTSSAMMTRRDPWVNMLRTTVACFAAGLGGADSVTVQPFDAAIGLPDEFARRVARNTQNLLLEESHLGEVIDPAAGSWYVEQLTDELARTAWTWFREIERAGGLPAAHTLVADRIARTWEQRSKRIADRGDAITGVSEFPNMTEKAISRTPAPEEPAGGLPRIRYAQAFERLRDLADAQDERPQVFLATLGPVSAHTARATFAANLFQAGGIATPAAGATATPEQVAEEFRKSGARIAVLCGSETSYAEQAVSTVEALRAAGAERILLAGKKTDAEVDGFVYAGCPALDILNDTFSFLAIDSSGVVTK